MLPISKAVCGGLAAIFTLAACGGGTVAGGPEGGETVEGSEGKVVVDELATPVTDAGGQTAAEGPEGPATGEGGEGPEGERPDGGQDCVPGTTFCDPAQAAKILKCTAAGQIEIATVCPAGQVCGDGVCVFATEGTEEGFEGVEGQEGPEGFEGVEGFEGIEGAENPDAGLQDAGSGDTDGEVADPGDAGDAGEDSGVPIGLPDAGVVLDGGIITDAGLPDAGIPDAGLSDAGVCSPVNACGGCAALAGKPGDPCGACGQWACDGPEAVKCDDPGKKTCTDYVTCTQKQICGFCPPKPTEICDGKDNDCDPATAEEGHQLNCGSGLLCKAGACCQSECEPFGTSVCDAGGKGLKTCGNFDPDGCYELGLPELCPANQKCVNGACQCVPQCTNKACGPDGCGGECGTCGSGTACDNNAQCMVPCSPGNLCFKVPPTMQSKCYDNNAEIGCPGSTGVCSAEPFCGQDAQYPDNARAYTCYNPAGQVVVCTSMPVAGANEVVGDSLTGLIWQRTFVAGKTWQQAIDYCDALTDAGKTDWRLPNIHELHSIHELQRVAPCIDTAAFPQTPSILFWSSSKYQAGAWKQDSGSGHVLTDDKTTALYVRCVRGEIPVSNAPRFKTTQPVSGAPVVTDFVTGLTWAAEVSPPSHIWADALSYCEGLNYAAFTDWRLPNANELMSLVNYAKDHPATDFPGMATDKVYWASSTYALSSSYGWNVNFATGVVTANNNAGKEVAAEYVKCVRGGP